MATLVSDTLKKADCAGCQVSQKQFGDLCAVCHFKAYTNAKMHHVIMREKNEIVVRSCWRFIIFVILAAIVGAGIFLISLWK